MKNIFSFLMLAILIVFAVALLTRVFEDQPPNGGHGTAGEGPGGEVTQGGNYHAALFDHDGDFEDSLKDLAPEVRKQRLAKREAKKEEIMKRRFEHLKDTLKLNAEQAEAVWAFEKTQYERDQAFRHSFRPLWKDMEALLDDENASEHDFGDVLDKMEYLEDNKMRGTERAHEDIQSVLSSRQQAQYLYFQKHYEKSMKNTKRWRNRNRQRPEGRPEVKGRGDGK